MATMEDLTPLNFVQLIKQMERAERNRITAKRLIDLIVNSPEPDQKIANLEGSLNAFKTMLDHIKDVATENKTEIGALKAANQKLTDENTALKRNIEHLQHHDAGEAENERTKERISELQDQIHEIEQYLRVNNLEIVGLAQPLQGETEETVIVNALNSLHGLENNPIRHEDIDISHPLKSRRRDGKPVHIVRFISRKKKLEILAAKKREENRQFKFRNEDVFINEHLNPTNRSIFAAAAEKKKNLNYKFLWTKNGVVHMRKTEESGIITIDKIEKLEELH